MSGTISKNLFLRGRTLSCCSSIARISIEGRCRWLSTPIVSIWSSHQPPQIGIQHQTSSPPVPITTHTTVRSFASRRNDNNKKSKGSKDDGPLVNEYLIARLVRNAGAASADSVMVRLVIDEGPDEPSKVEVMSLSDAIQVSIDKGVDLVGVAIENDPPVVRATDLSKLQFQQLQFVKKKQQDDSNKETKSFRFRSGIDGHDLERKLSQMISFLEKGHDCDYSVFTRSRNLRENEDAGIELVNRIQSMVSELATLKREPEKNETGSFYKVMLRPKKSQKD
jgi:translation initiation factor IF-3